MAQFMPLRMRTGFQARLIGDSDRSDHRPDGDDETAGGSGSALADPDTAVAITHAEGELARLEESVGERSAESDDADADLPLPTTAAELASIIEEAATAARESVEEALADSRNELDAERAALKRMMDEMGHTRKRWSREVKEQLGSLLLTGVRQIVGESVELQVGALESRLVEVGQRLVGEQEVLLRVRPADEDLARKMVDDRSGWKVIPDESVVAGGCIAETDAGRIDASMGAGVAGVANAVRDWIEDTEFEGGEE